VSGPKTLAERLDWMAKNLPGFSQELDEVAAIERRATGDSAAVQPVQFPHVEVLARSSESVQAVLCATRLRAYPIYQKSDIVRLRIEVELLSKVLPHYAETH
jgi:hypothetical protein